MTRDRVAARLVLDRARAVAPVRRRTFGGFLEHLGRAVYDGIYEPGHPEADGDGFRRDVTRLVRELGVTSVRYPGGNFVSGFRWEDSVGPRETRPVRRDLAWHCTETNQVGLDEFARWAHLVDSELMLAVNLGTRGIQEALDLLEYANHPSGTALSDARIANGSAAPHDVRLWCLGNEMDGPWQIGHRSAEDYGVLAARTAAAMKMADPGLELVACGSSGSGMPTFGAWERTVLEHAYEHIDYLSCHAYYREQGGDLGSFLASSLDMQHVIDTVVAIADGVRARTGAAKRMLLSFDEWNIWYIDEDQAGQPSGADWPVAPRLLEDVYSVADAVVSGSLLITLLKNSDRVGSASLAQLVNVIAPIMTEPGGPAWRQTTFFPFAAASRLARGVVLAPLVTSPVYDTAAYGTAPVCDAVATYDASRGASAVFLVNRSVEAPLTVTMDARDLAPHRLAETLVMADPDVYAKNTRADPERVRLQESTNAVLEGGIVSITVPPVSWTAIALE